MFWWQNSPRKIVSHFTWYGVGWCENWARKKIRWLNAIISIDPFDKMIDPNRFKLLVLHSLWPDDCISEIRIHFISDSNLKSISSREKDGKKSNGNVVLTIRLCDYCTVSDGRLGKWQRFLCAIIKIQLNRYADEQNWIRYMRRFVAPRSIS